jgi:hypothetical protein
MVDADATDGTVFSPALDSKRWNGACRLSHHEDGIGVCWNMSQLQAV